MLKGCDLAFPIQGELDDAVWTALEEEGVRFAGMRLVVGNNPGVDTAAVLRHLPRARAHNVLPYPYWFPFPLPHLDPKEQVERFVREVEALGGLGLNVGDLPPAIDMEWPEREKREADGSISSPWKKFGCSAPQIRDWLAAAIARGEELTGVKWLRYTYRYWLSCIEGEKLPELAAGPLWLADYAYQGKWVDDFALALLKPPAPWDKITIVQHDGNGGLKLPNGRDADFNMFLGDEVALLALAGEKGQISEDLSALASVAHAEASGLISEDEIAEFRRTRIDEAA